MTLRLDVTVLDLAREKSGFKSDARLGAELEVSMPTIYSWRHGKTVPSVKNLVRLRRLSGLPLDAMVYDDGKTNNM